MVMNVKGQTMSVSKQEEKEKKCETKELRSQGIREHNPIDIDPARTVPESMR